MQVLDLHGMWFQQHAATCHTARLRMNLLTAESDEHFISRSEPINWPPRSCHLTSLDYFLWCYVKAHVYADNLEVFIREIPVEMLERVCQYWTKRMDHLKRSLDQHLHEIIFKH